MSRTAGLGGRSHGLVEFLQRLQWRQSIDELQRMYHPPSRPYLFPEPTPRDSHLVVTGSPQSSRELSAWAAQRSAVSQALAQRSPPRIGCAEGAGPSFTSLGVLLSPTPPCRIV